MVISPFTVGTLFAMAKVLWKIVLTNSMEKEGGSVVVAVHVIVTVFPDARGAPACELVGGLMVKAETRGRASASVLDNQVEDDDREAT